MNVFLACPISMEVEEVEKVRMDLEAAMKEIENLNVVTSKSDFEANFSRAGSWSNWIDRVVKGRDYQTQKELFQAYVTVHPNLGKATADILRGAMGQSKPVLLFADGMLRRASGVQTVDVENWQTGWALTF